MHILISQDTVIGLQALSEFAELIYTPDIDITVQLTSSVDPNFRKTITVNQENSMVLQLVEVITYSHSVWRIFYPFTPTVQPRINHWCRLLSLWIKPLVCYHSDESYWAVLSYCTVYYALQGGSNFLICALNPIVCHSNVKLSHAEVIMFGIFLWLKNARHHKSTTTKFWLISSSIE